MTADDYVAMVGQYDNNATMLRFLGKYAKEAIDNSKDSAERAKLRQVVDATQAGSKVRREWDTLIQGAEIYSGQSRRNNDPEMVLKMSRHWDEEEQQKAVESF